MELNSNDKKVINLLSKLKNSNGAYPSDILAARREAYLKQMANVGLGIGVSAGIKHAAKGNHAAGAIVTSKILETVLIVAIAVEAGAATYLYRGKIADLIRTYTGSSKVEEVAPPAVDTATLVPEMTEITESPSATALTPSGTPSPVITETNNNNANNTDPNIAATPNPDGTGNQYGLTPKPIRTKDNTDNTNSGNNSNYKP